MQTLKRALQSSAIMLSYNYKTFKIIAVWNVQEGALQDKLYGFQRAQGSSLQLASVTCVSL